MKRLLIILILAAAVTAVAATGARAERDAADIARVLSRHVQNGARPQTLYHLGYILYIRNPTDGMVAALAEAYGMVKAEGERGVALRQAENYWRTR